ncbi:MAG TPA: hypothetical protein VJR23_05795 [Candidatus Acidoferrales bacterium]|nr:hypothetical protein [Candidatus Acidoferrales bacterium]
MSENCGQETAGPSTNPGEENSDNESREKPPRTLVQMRKREKSRRAQDSQQDTMRRPILQNALHETAINKFFADRHCSGKQKKDSALRIVLRKDLHRQLRNGAADFVWASGETAQAEQLVGENEQAKNRRNNGYEPHIWNLKRELHSRYMVRARPPGDDPDSDPLEKNRRGVEDEAIAFFRLWRTHQQADTAAAEPRDDRGKKQQNQCEIKRHGAP